MDRYSKHLAYSALRGQACEVELVTRRTLADGSVQETSNVRLAKVKRVTRRGNRTILTMADIDRDALERVYPFEKYTVADFPELFIDHVGWYVTQGIGTLRKVPLVLISKTGGVWKYGVAKAIGPVPLTVLAVYRGHQPGQGAVIPVAEYTSSLAVGATTGLVVHTINFTREQIDFDGKQFVLEADVIQPNFGPTNAPEEIRRVLTAFGIATETASFGAASGYDQTAGLNIDPCYGIRDKGRKGIAILEDLLLNARAWLIPTAAGEWGITQDVPKAATLQFDTSIRSDGFAVEEYGDGEDLGKSVVVAYRPKTSGLDDDPITLPTSGVGDVRFTFPYVSDHTVADKLRSYFQKRLNTLKTASGTAHATQVPSGVRISVTEQINWSGTKDFIATAVGRPADRSALKLREYVADVYVYTPGTLPADATNGYSPDYSFTDPLAPTGLVVVSQGITVDSDGKLKAHALFRATPPAVNWQRLIVQVRDLTTDEKYQAQLLLAGGNYEVTIGGLSPGRNHEVRAWAVNANNRDGAITAAVAFTSANSANAPSAVTVGVQQLSMRQVFLTWTEATPGAGSTPIDYYIVDRKAGAGAFATIAKKKTLDHVDDNIAYATAYQYKVRAVDRNGNIASDSNLPSITPQALITDTHVVPQGISGPSIADASINRARTNTGTGSASGTLGAGTSVFVGIDKYAFAPPVGQSSGTVNTLYRIGIQGSLTDDAAAESILNVSAGSVSWDVRWRSFPP